MIKVPARIIRQLDAQIKRQQAVVESAQKYLLELMAAREAMTPIDNHQDKVHGGHARAKALSANRRSEIASNAAKTRWNKR